MLICIRSAVKVQIDHCLILHVRSVAVHAKYQSTRVTWLIEQMQHKLNQIYSENLSYNKSGLILRQKALLVERIAVSPYYTVNLWRNTYNVQIQTPDEYVALSYKTVCENECNALINCGYFNTCYSINISLTPMPKCVRKLKCDGGQNYDSDTLKMSFT